MKPIVKPVVSRKGFPDASGERRSFATPTGDYRRPTGRPNVPVSPQDLLSNWGAVIALWAPAYLALLDHFGGVFVARSEALEWVLVAVGVVGLGSVLYLAWQDTRDPQWRAAHGLLRRTPSNAAGH